MTKQILVSAAGVFAAVSIMSSQELIEKKSFQVFTKAGTATTFGTAIVKGKPFSATEEQHFLQILSDGTRVETRQTTRIYRDSDGRMRLEDSTPGGKTQPGFEFGPIIIVDPVAVTRTAINPQTRQKQTLPTTLGTTLRILVRDAVNGQLRGDGVPVTVTTVPAAGQKGKQGASAVPVEDLGMKNVNGVMAHGERTTTVIPAADIGANRDVRVVNERWYSDDLQLLIKSTNTDPRFGDTTYQLTGIVQGEQNPTLFQVPADYAEVQGRGGARSGGPAEGGPGGRKGGGRGARSGDAVPPIPPSNK